MLSKILLPATIPMKILFVLVSKFNAQGFMFLRHFKKYCNKDSQISHSLNSLIGEKYIVREKVGRQTKIIITDKGRRYINRYLSSAEKYISNFLNFFKIDISISNLQSLSSHIESLENKVIKTEIMDILSILKDTHMVEESQIISLANELVQVFKDYAIS